METLMHQLTRGREDSTLERNVSDVSDDENLSTKEIDIYDTVTLNKHALSPNSKNTDGTKKRRLQNRKIRSVSLTSDGQRKRNSSKPSSSGRRTRHLTRPSRSTKSST